MCNSDSFMQPDEGIDISKPVRWVKTFVASVVVIAVIVCYSFALVWAGYNTGVVDTIDWLKAKKQQKGDAPLMIYGIPKGRPYLTKPTGDIDE